MNNKFFKFRKARQWIFALSAFMFVFAACNDDDDTKSKTVHDPNKPVELTSFKPDSGRIAEMVILDGSNFGSDTSNIKVFFNAKEARVLSSTGTRLLALVPRLPGDNCIISVQVGDRSYAYDATFRYKMEASVTTFAGTNSNAGQGEPVLTDLEHAQFQPVYIGVDKDFNLFLTIQNQEGMLLKLDPNDLSITVLATYANHGLDYHSVPCAHPETGMLILGCGGIGKGNGQRDRFITLDPKEGWAPKNRYIKNWIENGFQIPNGETVMNQNEAGESHYSVLYCEADECYYTRYLTGQIVKINPKTWEAEVIYQSNSGIVWGMAFHPVRKTELWLAYNNGEGAELANSLCRLDVSNPGTSFEKMGGTPSTGFRDGPLAQAQFYGIRMISFDSEGGLFVGDGGNSCIRRVDTQTMMVETIIGIPGVAGFKNGKKEDALFHWPHGIVVDPEDVIYVADYNNFRVRRIAVE